MENNLKPKVYITGGLGKIFRDKIIYKPIYMEHLTLEGIKEIGTKHFYE
jgi:pantothenate kinase type III